MLFRIALCCLLFLSAKFLVAEDAAREDSSGRLLFVGLAEHANKKKTLAACAMEIPEKGEFAFVSGGETASVKFDGRFVGTRVTGTLINRVDRHVELELTIEMGERIQTDDPETEMVVADKVAFRTRLEIGKEKTIRFGRQRACTVRIE